MFRMVSLALICAGACLGSPITSEYYQVLDDSGSPLCDSRDGGCSVYSGMISVGGGSGVGVVFQPDSIYYLIQHYGGPSIYNQTDKTVRYFYNASASLRQWYVFRGGSGGLDMRYDFTFLPHDNDFKANAYQMFVQDFTVSPFPTDGESTNNPAHSSFNDPFEVNLGVNVSLIFDVFAGEVGGGQLNTAVAAQFFNFTQDGQPVDVRLVAVPEPLSFFLLGSGILALIGFRKLYGITAMVFTRPPLIR